MKLCTSNFKNNFKLQIVRMAKVPSFTKLDECIFKRLFPSMSDGVRRVIQIAGQNERKDDDEKEMVLEVFLRIKGAVVNH